MTTANGCQGTYGYIEVFDSGNGGKATSYNHAFFAQDAWTIGRGLTINVGVRLEHENLPGEFDSVGVTQPPSGFPANPISFGWGSKIAPRLGAAWDVFKRRPHEGVRQLWQVLRCHEAQPGDQFVRWPVLG